MDIIQDLYSRGIINQERKSHLVLQLESSGKTEEEILLENNIIAEIPLFELKSKLLNIPFFKLEQKEISQDVLGVISASAALNYNMVPLFKKGNVVGVGMAYPEDISSQNALRFLGRKENVTYHTYVITLSDVRNILKQYKTLKIETNKALEELSGGSKEISGGLGQDLASLKVADEEAPVIKMVLVILRHAVEGNASDIHIEPNRERLNIRFRQDGLLHLSLFLPLAVHPSIVSRIKILANLKIDENRIPQDGRFTAHINNEDVDFRVATFPTLYGEKVEMRVLNSAAGLQSFDKLGLRPQSIELIKEALKKPYGLILSSGPTGSGKTTMLYELINLLNKETVNIVTIEDPIEYSIAGINQSQIKPEIGYSFAQGLRQILRQDPNIIMVGEIRDEETAGLVVNAALTGHLVLSTLHTNSAVGVIPRLIDLEVKPFLIPSTLRLVIAQRLIRMLCQRCKKKVAPNEKIKKYIVDTVKTMPAEVRQEIKISELLEIYQARGCEACGYKGYKGRMGLFEILPMTDQLAGVILKNPAASLILKIAQKEGMLTMAQEGMLKVLSGQTTIEEIARATQEE